MRTIFLVVLLLLLSLWLPAADKKEPKPWNKWSAKDAQKILDDSAWGQTQTESDMSEMFFSPTSGRESSRAQRGAFNETKAVNFRIRFLSAKPIRQAFARLIENRQSKPDPQLSAGLKDFVERKFDQFIAVAVTYDSQDQRLSGAAMQLFAGATTGTLQNRTYLELSNGQRLFLQEYKQPIADGLGAKFIFPRLVDGKPFVDEKSEDLRFYSEIGALKLNMRFKLADMNYEGALEY
ncbi:MAG: hypothetical protein EHM61_28570 [Acidobacteria bacterium]|nr:MAG: hypothetical protein EHM61_28570 [Acidobacteriota bacterium]